LRSLKHRISPLKDSSGKVVKWFGTNTDINDQRKIREGLKETVKARDEFISIVSHELKTPLTTLILHTQMLEKQINLQGPDSLQVEKPAKSPLS
jgi:signal transduction histidine kinase